MNNNTKNFYEQMEIDAFYGEINDEELVRELPESSLIPLLYMTQGIQKDNLFHRKSVKVNGMAIAWEVSVVCD